MHFLHSVPRKIGFLKLNFRASYLTAIYCGGKGKKRENSDKAKPIVYLEGQHLFSQQLAINLMG